ncbi:hypothetical protein D3C74_443490 [compost metagenome]
MVSAVQPDDMLLHLGTKVLRFPQRGLFAVYKEAYSELLASNPAGNSVMPV